MGGGVGAESSFLVSPPQKYVPSLLSPRAFHVLFFSIRKGLNDSSRFMLSIGSLQGFVLESRKGSHVEFPTLVCLSEHVCWFAFAASSSHPRYTIFLFL